jgi:hypothetical protein
VHFLIDSFRDLCFVLMCCLSEHERNAPMFPTRRLAIASFSFLVFGIGFCYAESPSMPLPSSATVVDVTDPEQIHRIISNFQQRLVELGSDRQVTTCDPLIYYYGQVTNTSRRGFSFGGTCVLSGKGPTLHLMMCNDFMIGKFSLKGWGNMNKEHLSHFTRENCPPGG